MENLPVKFTIETFIDPSDSIMQEISDPAGKIYKQVIKTQDDQVRTALISLGWKPPAKATKSMTDPKTTTPLSPSAQAVLDAANGASSYGPDDCLNDARWIAPAALRAAVDQHRLDPEHWEGSAPDEYERGWNEALDAIQHTAIELENNV